MKKFLIKLLLFTSPVSILLVLYLVLDPFKVLWSYDSYYESGKPWYVSPNKDYISTQNWINKYPVYCYDSYIFGNSRSIFYEIDTWVQYIHSEKNKCYHFDAAGESLYGIERKIKFLSSYNNVEIKNAIIVLDYSTLIQVNNSTNHISIKHPALSGQDRMSFQLEFIKTFFDHRFLRAYLDFTFSGKVKKYMKEKSLLDDVPVTYNNITNEMIFFSYEKMIGEDSASFYKTRDNIFYKRNSTINASPKVIGKEQKTLLSSIKRKLDFYKTNYRIVINPLYDQVPLNPADLEYLYVLFGKDKVFDFSGKNQYTSDKHNYYEDSHYRPLVSADIMRRIYQSNF